MLRCGGDVSEDVAVDDLAFRAASAALLLLFKVAGRLALSWDGDGVAYVRSLQAWRGRIENGLQFGTDLDVKDAEGVVAQSQSGGIVGTEMSIGSHDDSAAGSCSARDSMPDGR